MFSVARILSRHPGRVAQMSPLRAKSTWSNVPQGPPDAILGITEAYNRDPSPLKISLGVGAYRDQNGLPYLLNSVKEAEYKLFSQQTNKEYTGISGVADFVQGARTIAYGKDTPVDRVVIAQSISGTGALRLGGEFLARWFPGNRTVYIPSPSWANHRAIFTDAHLKVESYRYYDKSTISLDLEGMLIDIKNAPEGSIFLLHACAHNPTGIDPTKEQWLQIKDAIAAKAHFAFFDMAYQGFASGDLDEDAYALRLFAKSEVPLCLAQSFAKNMGLYGERVGAFSILCSGPEEQKKMDSQLKIVIRPMYSNPPIHGALIAATVLKTPELFEQWKADLKTMSGRIQKMRLLLREKLEAHETPGDWSHLTNQIGMFAFTGLKPDHMKRLASDCSVYATMDGRISVAGITEANVDRLAASIHQILTT